MFWKYVYGKPPGGSRIPSSSAIFRTLQHSHLVEISPESLEK